MIETVRNLPDPVRVRLTLENDEYAYSSSEILEVYRAANIPIVFNAHHIIHEKLDSYDDLSVDEMLEAARQTWEVPEWQLVHISNGAMSFQDTRHSDYIYDMPRSYQKALWIEIEAKQKEEAIAQLRQESIPTLTATAPEHPSAHRDHCEQSDA